MEGRPYGSDGGVPLPLGISQIQTPKVYAAPPLRSSVSSGKPDYLSQMNTGPEQAPLFYQVHPERNWGATPVGRLYGRLKCLRRCSLERWRQDHQKDPFIPLTLSLSLSLFPLRYLYTKGLSPMMSLLWVSPQTSSSIIKERYSQKSLELASALSKYEQMTLWDLIFD